MDLSPNDIRNYEFPNQMRGYGKDEVDSLLDQVAVALEEAKQNNLKLSMEVDSLKSQLTSLKQFEDTIKSAAIDARRNADTTVANAKLEAETMLAKARQEAEELTTSRTRSVDELEEQITHLGVAKKSYLSKFRALIQSHMDLLVDVDSGELPTYEEKEVEESTGDNISVTDSTDVTTESRESLANEPTEEEEALEASAAQSGTDEVPDETDENEPSDVPEDSKPAETESPIDPELAAALENYKQGKAQEAPQESPMGSRPNVVETTARAEDIPRGFIAKEDDLSGDQQTDKVVVKGKQGSVEPNSLNVDGSDDKPPLDPEQLAEALDEVAAKLDEKFVEANPS